MTTANLFVRTKVTFMYKMMTYICCHYIKYYFGCYMLHILLPAFKWTVSKFFILDQKFRNGLSTSFESVVLECSIRLLKTISCLIIKTFINIDNKIRIFNYRSYYVWVVVTRDNTVRSWIGIFLMPIMNVQNCFVLFCIMNVFELLYSY